MEKRIFYKSALVLVLILCPGFLTGQSVYDLILKADALNKGGDPVSAIKLLTPFLESTPDSRLYALRAQSYLANGDYESAAADYTSAEKLKEGAGAFGLSGIYSIRGDAAGAIKFLEKGMSSSARKSEKEIMLDPAFSRIENSPEWRQFWKKDWYPASERDLSQLEYLIGTGKIDDAADLVASMAGNYPGDVNTEYARALLNSSAGKNDEAVKILTSLLSGKPDERRYLSLLAQIQVNMSNYAGGSATLSKMISLEIPDATLFLKRAECYRKNGELKNASADIDKFLSLYPADKGAIRMAGLLKAASGDNLGAIGYYSENIRLNPGDAGCFNDRANAYFISKSWDWAIKDYSMSLDLDPANSEVWLNKGIALINSGKEADACHDFRMSFNLGNKKATEYISKYCIK